MHSDSQNLQWKYMPFAMTALAFILMYCTCLDAFSSTVHALMAVRYAATLQCMLLFSCEEG